MTLPLAPLRTFHLVARHLSFSRAARHLGVTQPAVTQQIRRIEQSLRQPLFHRDGRRLLMTEAGQTLAPFAERILTLADDARGALESMAALETGHLKVGASRTAGSYYVSGLLDRFKKRHPGVRVSLSIGNSQTIVAGVLDFSLHAGLVAGHPANPALVSLPFVRDRLLAIVPPEHALARKRAVSIRDLRGLPLVLREPGSATRRTIEEAFEAHGLTVEPSMELESNEAIKTAVAGGLGVAILAQAAVTQDVGAGRLAARRLRESLTIDFTLVHHRDRVLSPILASLLAVRAGGRSSTRRREAQADHGPRAARTV